ncbi:hypothetical protein M5K25_012983 [Dendrobium thyrsiflorum]|uniref:beta-galactosidase n=1 Tax=Dendrobium thyrsiflorum TaxID=117978 RepID=A0ABD0UYI3_DENTH
MQLLIFLLEIIHGQYLSCRRGIMLPENHLLYQRWLTHWGEPNAKTSASYTAAYLEKILSCNGSVVLYMAYGGTNFGFFNGANTGQNDSDYKADLTSYDYDAPIKESGDVDNPKFEGMISSAL